MAGVDHPLGRQVTVINMSLAGDANELLRRPIEKATTERAVIFVAAVGHDGPRAGPR